MPSAPVDWTTLATTLRHDGFCVVPAVLDDVLLARLKSAADDRGERWDERSVTPIGPRAA